MGSQRQIPEDTVFSVRNVCCDYYLAPSISDFDSCSLSTVADVILQKDDRRRSVNSSPRKTTAYPKSSYVPVIRIFGSTPASQKCCLHIHGVFPYFLILSPLDPLPKNYLEQLAAGIDRALNIASNQRSLAYGGKQTMSRKFVFCTETIYGIPYYGYHTKEVLFLKVSFYNPAVVKRAGEILRGGAVMQTVFQPHQLHVPYLLQFFIDYNLYGMDLVFCKSIKFRRNNVRGRFSTYGSNPVSSQDLWQKKWDLGLLTKEWFHDAEKMSICELEADCLATDLLNRITPGNEIKNPGLRFIWDDEKLRQKGKGDPIVQPKNEERPNAEVTESEMYFLDIFCDRLDKILGQPANGVTSVPSYPSSSCQAALNDGERQRAEGYVGDLVDESIVLSLSRAHSDVDANGEHEGELLNILAGLRDEAQTPNINPNTETNSTPRTSPVELWAANSPTPLSFSVDRNPEREEEEEEEERRNSDSDEEFFQMSQRVADYMNRSKSDSEEESDLAQLDGPVAVKKPTKKKANSQKRNLKPDPPKPVIQPSPSQSGKNNGNCGTFTPQRRLATIGAVMSLPQPACSSGSTKIRKKKRRKFYSELQRKRSEFLASKGHVFGGQRRCSCPSCIVTDPSTTSENESETETSSRSFGQRSQETLENVKRRAPNRRLFSRKKRKLDPEGSSVSTGTIARKDHSNFENDPEYVHKGSNGKSSKVTAGNTTYVRIADASEEDENRDQDSDRNAPPEAVPDSPHSPNDSRDGLLVKNPDFGYYELSRTPNKVAKNSVHSAGESDAPEEWLEFETPNNRPPSGIHDLKLKIHRKSFGSPEVGSGKKKRGHSSSEKHKRKSCCLQCADGELFTVLVPQSADLGKIGQERLILTTLDSSVLQKYQRRSVSLPREGILEASESVLPNTVKKSRSLLARKKRKSNQKIIFRSEKQAGALANTCLQSDFELGDVLDEFPTFEYLINSPSEQQPTSPINDDAEDPEPSEHSGRSSEEMLAAKSLIDLTRCLESAAHGPFDDTELLLEDLQPESVELALRALRISISQEISEEAKNESMDVDDQRRSLSPVHEALSLGASLNDRVISPLPPPASIENEVETGENSENSNDGGTKEMLGANCSSPNTDDFLEPVDGALFFRSFITSVPIIQNSKETDENLSVVQELSTRTESMEPDHEPDDSLLSTDTRMIITECPEIGEEPLNVAQEVSRETSSANAARPVDSKNDASPAETVIEQATANDVLVEAGGPGEVSVVPDSWVTPACEPPAPQDVMDSLILSEDSVEHRRNSEDNSSQKCAPPSETGEVKTRRKKKKKKRHFFARRSGPLATADEVDTSERSDLFSGNEAGTAEVKEEEVPKREEIKQSTVQEGSPERDTSLSKEIDALLQEEHSLSGDDDTGMCEQREPTTESNECQESDKMDESFSLQLDSSSDTEDAQPENDAEAIIPLFDVELESSSDHVSSREQEHSDETNEAAMKLEIEMKEPDSGEDSSGPVVSPDKDEYTCETDEYQISDEGSRETGDVLAGGNELANSLETSGISKIPAFITSVQPLEEVLHPDAAHFPSETLKRIKARDSQIEPATPGNSYGFNASEANFHNADVFHEKHHVSVLSMELLTDVRDGFCPDPNVDQINSIIIAVCSESDPSPSYTAFLSVCPSERNCEFLFSVRRISVSEKMLVESEEQLIDKFVEQLQTLDPDILVGYEIQGSSWGYLLERGSVLHMDLCPKLSRIPEAVRQSAFSTEDRWWSLSDVHIAGRIVLNLWRVLRHEIALNSYKFENTVFNLLHERVPYYQPKQLCQWFHSVSNRWRVFEYSKYRVEKELAILVHCDILNRTTEMAKLYGIQFFDVLSRGTQFRVESMMYRMTRKENYVAMSPSVNQRNRMAAPECTALTMEPESGFYKDPVLVLDFQSLYPSMCIAYNYCYSTCLGKIRKFSNDDDIEFGCDRIKLRPELLKCLKDDIHISPAGVAFVKPHIRHGVIPVMLDEILSTRIMVKNCMKQYKEAKSLLKVLDARQLALKMIANVTYGYTSANFSGRMPCVEVADSIVHKGRETLERAIKLVNGHHRWNGRVIYGDTDSLFVLLKDQSKESAFEIGNEIAAAVTELNPEPVKLKFEKVFYPCVLETKKRYVGFSYEHPDQETPVFDAKGIETVRRDTCPAVSKILEKSLKILFTSGGKVDLVKQYLIRQFGKIQTGRVGLENFIFAKEYRGRRGYRPGACVPALEIAKKRSFADRRSEPRMKERVPYVIVSGPPNSTLISCVREPQLFLNDPSLRLNYEYYINGQIIPALNRVFLLMGHDVKQWYGKIGKRARGHEIFGGLRSEGMERRRNRPQRTLSQFFKTSYCPSCGELTMRGLCFECRENPDRTLISANQKIREMEKRWTAANHICRSCVGSRMEEEIGCESVDCPVFARRLCFARDMRVASAMRKVLLDELLSV